VSGWHLVEKLWIATNWVLPFSPLILRACRRKYRGWINANNVKSCRTSVWLLYCRARKITVKQHKLNAKRRTLTLSVDWTILFKCLEMTIVVIWRYMNKTELNWIDINGLLDGNQNTAIFFHYTVHYWKHNYDSYIVLLVIDPRKCSGLKY